MRRLIIPLTLVCVALSTQAKDLGVQGTVWPIVERDIRQMMVEDAAKVEWSKVQEEILESGKSYLDNLPKRRFAAIGSTRTEWLDPSVELSSDIQIPVKSADGTFTWKVLAEKGTRVNPLVQSRPVTALLFFDGADPDQLTAVAEALKAEPLRLVPVEAGQGSLRDSNTRLARPVFHASDAMLNRFQIRYLPSIVHPGMADRALFLGITSFAAPFSAREILAVWPELTQLPANADVR